MGKGIEGFINPLFLPLWGFEIFQNKKLQIYALQYKVIYFIQNVNYIHFRSDGQCYNMKVFNKFYLKLFRKRFTYKAK